MLNRNWRLMFAGPAVLTDADIDNRWCRDGHPYLRVQIKMVKPELAFDVCWEVYRGAREVLETKRGVSALNWQESKKYLWRPDIRPRLNEWVADFALAGQAALDEPQSASRLVMFRMYYLSLAPYETARHFLGLSEHSWVNWSEEIRRRCGAELLRRGMFPPRKYFSMAP